MQVIVMFVELKDDKYEKTNRRPTAFPLPYTFHTLLLYSSNLRIYIYAQLFQVAINKPI